MRSCVTHWAGTRHCPETRPGPMRALTGRSGPLIPLSKASSQGRSCAWGCHILRSGPPPAGAPWLLEDTMEGGEEGAVLTLQGPRPEPRTPSPSPQARATWPLVQAFLRRLSANWHQDRKGSRQAGLLHPGCPLLTGARHGQPHQPVLAAALGSGGSVLAQVRVSMRHASSPARPLDVPGLTPRDQELEGGQSRAPPSALPFTPELWCLITSLDTMHRLNWEQRSQQADLHPEPWAQVENCICISHSRHVGI